MGDISGLDWGSLPAWVSSVSAVLALLFAATAAVIARRTFLIQSEQHRVNADDRRARAAVERAEQASLVSIWWSRIGSEYGSYIRNSSWAPVYQVHVVFVRAGSSMPFAKIDLPVVPPGDHPEFHSVPAQWEIDGVYYSGEFRARMTFTDAAGTRWIRDEYGRLLPLEPELSIWTGDDFANVLVKFQKDFQSAFGVTVDFKINNDLSALRENFIANAQGGEDVDVLVGPHDWVGELVAQRAVEPAVISAEHHTAFVDWTTRALSADGQLYGIPATMDTVVLIRNVDLAPDQPETFEDALAVGQALKARGLVSEAIAIQVGTEGDPYQIWPLFTSAGGWLFGQRADGTFDPTVVGFSAPESVAALERIGSLGESGAKVLRREIDRAAAYRLFCAGRTPFILGMYGTIAAVQAAGIRVAVCPVPRFRDGVAAKPFVSVYGFYIAPHGKNRTIAEDLISDYLTRQDVMSEVSARLTAPVARRGQAGPAIPRSTRCPAPAKRGCQCRLFRRWRLFGGCLPGRNSTSSSATIRRLSPSGPPRPSRMSRAVVTDGRER